MDSCVIVAYHTPNCFFSPYIFLVEVVLIKIGRQGWAGHGSTASYYPQSRKFKAIRNLELHLILIPKNFPKALLRCEQQAVESKMRTHDLKP